MSVNPASNPLTDINGVCSTATTTIPPAVIFTDCSRLERRFRSSTRTTRDVSIARHRRRRGQRLARARRRHRPIERRRPRARRASTLSGSVGGAKASSRTVYIGSVTIPVPSPLTLNGATNDLPPSFVVLTQPLPPPAPPPTAVSPDPVVATGAELALLRCPITPVSTAAHSLCCRAFKRRIMHHSPPTAAYPDGLWLFSAAGPTDCTTSPPAA